MHLNYSGASSLRHFSGQGTKAAFMQQQHTVVWKRIFKRKPIKVGTTHRHSSHTRTAPLVFTSQPFPSQAPILNPSLPIPHGRRNFTRRDSSGPQGSSCRRVSRACARLGSDYLWPGRILWRCRSFRKPMGMDGSEDWRNVEEEDCPSWQVGLTGWACEGRVRSRSHIMRWVFEIISTLSHF